MPRLFQTQTVQLCNDIIDGAMPHRTFYAPIIAGGGKSSLPVILTRLIPHIADKICWLVPRVTLASQAEQAFVSKRLKILFPHDARIRHDTNTANPSRGTHGYTTTYQAVVADPSLHRQEFERHRYILFLDEPHHIKTHFSQPEHREFVLSHAIQPLVERAKLVFYASGTFARHDRKPIFGLPYAPTSNGYEVDFPVEQKITYGRKIALEEHSIVKLEFLVRDSKAAWRDTNGVMIERGSFDETSSESGQMVEAVLETEFARQLLADTVTHWIEHRQHFPPGKLLVVAPKIALARRYMNWLKHDHNLKVDIATSDDSAKAKEAIANFKGRRQPALDVLVTVGMAYEGLDVPEITHIACLTRYRSKPWLEQCFARACRVVEGKHRGYIFAPDDPLLNQVVAYIQAEQDAAVKDQAPLETATVGTGGIINPSADIMPLSSLATETRAFNFDEGISREETARLSFIMQQFGIFGTSPMQFKLAAEAVENAQALPSKGADVDDDALTPSEIEERYRVRIDEYTKMVDYTYFQSQWGTTNLEIRKAGFPSRDEMTEAALAQLWEWLPKRFPRKEEGN